jgi:hypothetical protein
MKLTTVAEFQDSTVAGGRRTQVYGGGDFETARQTAIQYFNGTSSSPFPFGRFASYVQNKKPSQDAVSVPIVSSPTEKCFCTYSLNKLVSVGTRSAYEKWEARFEICADTSAIKLISATVPFRNILFLVQPDFTAVKYSGSPSQWFFYLDPQDFESGYCMYQITEFRVHNSVGGGVESDASSESDTTTPNTKQPVVAGSTVSFTVSNSVYAYRQVWGATTYSTKGQCSFPERMDSRYTAVIEVDLL